MRPGRLNACGFARRVRMGRLVWAFLPADPSQRRSSRRLRKETCCDGRVFHGMTSAPLASRRLPRRPKSCAHGPHANSRGEGASGRR